MQTLLTQTKDFLSSFSSEECYTVENIRLLSKFCKYYYILSESSEIKEEVKFAANELVRGDNWEDLIHCNYAMLTELLYVYLLARTPTAHLQCYDQSVYHALQNSYIYRKEWPYFKYAEIEFLLNELEVKGNQKKMSFYETFFFKPLYDASWKRTSENELEFFEYSYVQLAREREAFDQKAQNSVKKWVFYAIAGQKFDLLCKMVYILSFLDPNFYGFKAAFHVLNKEELSIEMAPILLPALENLKERDECLHVN
ncbi:hypothetical protein [Bacillus sp. C28GYM-DRY-1]|uniref:hypothetical protein n=1 Tax=Bacillus sp. C28GYM-DRY-1 TaxID=3062686 RepID=UPI0026750975|nr:hypothetical protein [Bacillus sp. C28GYM-DRY-1]MDO3662401.1 hypothetical protein [Bacillus sp. C28GYM-DRY-1]